MSQEDRSGSWPLQNIRLANSAASELPECLMWLRRDYNPAKTEQTYEQSAEKHSKPVFRVRLYNRSENCLTHNKALSRTAFIPIVIATEETLP